MQELTEKVIKERLLIKGHRLINTYRENKLRMVTYECGRCGDTVTNQLSNAQRMYGCRSCKRNHNHHMMKNLDHYLRRPHYDYYRYRGTKECI